MTDKPEPQPEQAVEHVSVCAVCGKRIRLSEDHVKVFHAGMYHAVCCASCAAKFEANPQQYVVIP